MSIENLGIFFKKYKITFLLIILIWLAFILFILLVSNDMFTNSFITLEKLGVLGDSLNVLTSLFTGLAFSGVIISVILQTKELEEARIEFRGQKDALYKQQEEMKYQSFDTKFFQMIHLLNEIKKSLKISANNHIYSNDDLFYFLKDKFERNIEMRYSNDHENSIHSIRFSYFKEEFNDFNIQYDTTFKYYFLNLYQIMKFIDSDIPNKSDSKKYMNILRAQLSKNELILLCYNAIGIEPYCGKGFKELIERYSFLEHLQYEDFCTNFKIIRLNNTLLLKFDKKAFGKNSSLLESIANLSIDKLAH